MSRGKKGGTNWSKKREGKERRREGEPWGKEREGEEGGRKEEVNGGKKTGITSLPSSLRYTWPSR